MEGVLETKIGVSDSVIVTTNVTNDCAQISPAEEAFRNEKGSNNDSLAEIVDDKDKTANEYNERISIGKDTSTDKRAVVHILDI